ncbi:MAG TPA: hypothetical protein VN541_05225 [Tepidisphaeraceae bacterium]|nr:hypothetical protein [Tepidisphaeraceae bacterium]
MQLKFISPTTHGIIDWLTAGMLPAIPRLFGWDKKATRMYDMLAGGIGATTAMTNFPPGLIKLMPLKTHLMIDKMNGALFLAAGAMLTDEPDSVRCCMASTGTFLLMQGFCTRTRKQEQAPPQQSFARQEPIQRYAEQMRPDVYAGAASAR